MDQPSPRLCQYGEERFFYENMTYTHTHYVENIVCFSHSIIQFRRYTNPSPTTSQTYATLILNCRH